MFRLPSINVKEKVTFKATLMRNRREKLMAIDNKFIGKVVRNLEEIDSFELDIPQYTTRNSENKFNPLYLKINPKQQIIVETFDNKGILLKTERFIVSEKARSKGKNKGNKTFKCYSFENTLKERRHEFKGKVLQLKSDETLIAEGILDIFEKETGWNIGYVDEKSRVETIKGVETVTDNIYTNFQKNKVEENGLIWEKDISTTIANDKPLYLVINYQNMKTYDDKGLLLKTESIPNTITEALYTNIKKVKAYHHSEVGNRYGIRYEFTLSDNVVVERICTFSNIVNKKITVDSVDLIWETGNIIEKEHVKVINVDSEGNWYDLMNDFMQQFNSIALYDTFEKRINVIHRDNIGKNSPLVLDFNTNIIKVDVTESSTYPNALKVEGKDGLTIASENMYGGDIIYNYDYYKNKKIMSDELISAWDRYVVLLGQLQEQWYSLNNQRYSVNQRKIKMDSQIKALTDRIKYNKNLLNGYIASGDKTNQEKIKLEIDSMTETLNGYMVAIKDYQDQIDKLDEDMSIVSSKTVKANATDSNGKIFTDLDLEELDDIETIEVYSDDYFSTPYGLLNEAQNKLKEMIVPQIDFKVDLKNLAQMILGDWNKVVVLGDLFKINDEELIVELNGEDKVRLVGYEFEPKTNKLSNFIFTNKTKKYDKKQNISSTGKQVANASSTINSFKNVWEDSILSNNFTKSLINGGLDLASQMARGKGARNYITIDECGILLEDQLDRNKCMLISSGLICISEDGFKTSKVAITPQAVMADVLAGHMIFGEKLVATSDKGVFEITGDGLTIYDENKKVRVKLGLFDIKGNIKAGLTLYDKEGNEVVLSEDGILNAFQFSLPDNLDSTHPMIIPFISDEGVNYYKQVILKGYNTRYRAFESGSASGGSVVTSSSGGGGTSASGGGGTSSWGGDYEIDAWAGVSTNWGDTGQFPYASVAFDPDDFVEVGGKIMHGHNIETRTLRHSHNVFTKTPSHNHTISSHQHQIYDHQHTLNTSHTHNLIYDIYESTMCSNMAVYVNDILVKSGINGNEFDVDITSYLTKGQTNIIKITTATNGRIVANVRVKEFRRW